MPSPLLSYAEASEQVRRFILARAGGGEVPSAETAGEGWVAAAPEAESARPADLLPAETVQLEACAGRVLAAPIRADRDQPPFPRSTRDGFACRAAEANTNQFLFLAGHVRAGEAPAGALGVGEAWEIMTGAPVPDGADAVFMVEHSEHNSNFVRLAAPRSLQPGENIVPRAAEAQAGEALIAPGVRLGPAQIALAAQCGCRELAVVAQPRVAILSTGDELVPVAASPGPSQIRNSNSPMLAALVAAAGAVPIVFPAVPDQESSIDLALAKCLVQDLGADLLLITGGISAGRFDLVEDALTRAGARFFFGGVAIQPGKPVVFGQLPRAGCRPLPFFALPGNPISSAVTFQLFAAPLLAALGGDSGPNPRFSLARLAGTWSGKPGLTRFLPALCDFGRAAEVRAIPWQGSGDLAAFARSNCLLVVPSDAEFLAEGSIVEILLT